MDSFMKFALTKQEIAELTNRRSRHLQRQALESMGISYMMRPDGTIFVAKASIFPEAKEKNVPITLNLKHLERE